MDIVSASFRLQGNILVDGAVEAPLLASSEALSFWGGYQSVTGEIIDRRHPLSGRIAKESILAIPGTRGSSTTTAVLLEAVRQDTAPAGFIISEKDTFLTLASIVAYEMYARVLPVIQVDISQFPTVLSGKSAKISKNGIVFIYQ